jgi:glycosyltransferase involved in cell wall biosynthesis
MSEIAAMQMWPDSANRIVFDVSTSMRWRGPPAGIVRVERQLGLWAYDNVPNAVFVFFDPNRRAYCEVICDVRQFLTGDAALDTLGLTNPARPGGRRTDRVPAAFKPAFLWVTQMRRIALARLERLRLETRRPRLARLADRLQRVLMSAKYRSVMVRADDTRRPFFPSEMAVGAPVAFGRDDTLVSTGSGWGHTNIEAVAELKTRVGFQMVLLCHDLIPLMFPHFYLARDIESFRNYMPKALAIADRVVVTSRRVAADCRTYCADHDIRVPEIVVTALGFDVGTVRPKPAPELPVGLRPGQFAMLVSTIEPRKGHRLLYTVWRRLMAAGVPQAADFKLVFVGRPGWLVEDLLADIASDPQTAKQILMIRDVDDDLLAALYQASAFCVYPSVYEGYGLPVVEAFSHGKAVLTSTGGALPELAQGFSPCLDPTDEQAWYETMRLWIESPQACAPYEREIRARFRHPNWSEVAANFFAGIPAAKATDMPPAPSSTLPKP